MIFLVTNVAGERSLISSRDRWFGVKRSVISNHDEDDDDEGNQRAELFPLPRDEKMVS